ncbi:hypothetical protein ACI65C_004689 [Semiaphis heraclei]
MGQNDENTQSCGSIRCCCKLISKSEKKPAAAVVAPKPPNNVVGGSSERSQISLCDFLNLHPIPEWIKINDVRPQQQRNQQRPMQPSTTDKPKGSSNAQEEVQSSQIIINFGTVVTSGVCKRDSGQQTDPAVQQRASPTTVSPSANRSSTSACPTAAKRSMPCNFPPAEPPSPKLPSADRSTSKCPPADPPSSKCPSTDRSTSKCPPVDRPASICPVPAAETPAAAPARDRCNNREKAPSTAVSSSPPKARTESVVKKAKCACNCHSDA